MATAQQKRTIEHNWDVIDWWPFRLDGDELVTDRSRPRRQRAVLSSGRRSALHRRLASAVELEKGEAVLKQGWQQFAVDFANDYFPPVAEPYCSADLRVPIARFGEEALLTWWMIRLRLELARGLQTGDLDAALRAALQVSFLDTHQVSRVPRLSRLALGSMLTQRSPGQYDAGRWIGLSAAALLKPQRLSYLPGKAGSKLYDQAKRRWDGAARFRGVFRPADRPPSAIQSLPRSDTDGFVKWFRTGEDMKRRTTADAERYSRLKTFAMEALWALLAERYRVGSVVRKLAGLDPLLRELESCSLRELNARIGQEARRRGFGHPAVGVLALGARENPEDELWDVAARTFVNVLNGRLTGSILMCHLSRPLYSSAVSVAPRFHFLTPLARIWFDFWKELGGMQDVRSCAVCYEPYPARTKGDKYCSKSCRKTAELRVRRQQKGEQKR